MYILETWRFLDDQSLKLESLKHAFSLSTLLLKVFPSVNYLLEIHTHTISFTHSLPLSSLPHSTVSRDGKVGFGFIWIQVNRRSRLSAFKKYWQQRRRRRRQKTKTKKLLWFSSPSKFFAEAHDDDLLLKDLFSVDTVSEHPFKKRFLPA